ncbi:hypothetical protein J1N35_005575 [Gossypium stocksii]|uniref:Uncharacterized protein n=1 Tax=Gossypium stocksii TaxID=47602 RepID=A0A9D3WG13_9ROSI|nr:hypothetical protein J1N35_005575 [Gossypium stocksii]
MGKMQGALNSIKNKLAKRNDALEVMMMALKKETMAIKRVLAHVHGRSSCLCYFWGLRK